MTAMFSRVVGGLKDFQRDTVEYVFDRLYAPGASGRFLVADEVGLGKTMIARGVIAKAIDLLREKRIPQIDVIYICSNGDIARQNINRLKVADEEHIPLVSRLTLLPRELARLKKTNGGVNFISFTPTTSFELHSGLGRADERILLYWMLRKAWGFGNGKASMNVFQGTSGADRFRQSLERFDPECISDVSHQDFRDALEKHAGLRERFESLCDAYSHSHRVVSAETSSERYRFIGELRTILAASCVRALEPDLIVLDEFQRFGHLLDDEDDTSRLARAMFAYDDVRVLLLSATPYKMYTTAGDPNGEDHYADFVRTLRFLEGRTGVDGTLDALVTGYRESLLRLGESSEAERARVREQMNASRRALEERLRRVMVRTERLASTPDRNGMLVEVAPRRMQVKATDLVDYLTTQRVAAAVEADDSLELWKSSPFVLSFAEDNYVLRRRIDVALDSAEGRAAVARVMATRPTATLPWEDIERYAEIDPKNARMRALHEDVIENGAWRLLWVPPSLPYYKLEGPFGEPKLGAFTKRLVFSSWRMVPRSIAALTSYEVDRRMMQGDPDARNSAEGRKRRRGLLNFKTTDARLSGMPVLALLYPSLYLAKMGDPCALLAERARESEDAGPTSIERITLEAVLAIARERIEVGLERLRMPAITEGRVDERWYWAAPLLLDRALDAKATRSWFEQPDLASVWAGHVEEEDGGDDDNEANSTTAGRSDETDAWREHVAQACLIALGDVQALDLGRRPDDLVEVLAELAVTGPAVAMLRSLDRVVGGESSLSEQARVTLRNGAGRTAWSFRALFNRGSVTWMLRSGVRGQTDVPYWRQVLRYCAEGCLPAVLDEYVHVLRDHLGLVGLDRLDSRVHEIADELREALELRPAQVKVQDFVLSDSGRTVRTQGRNLVTQFAARFADESNDDGTATRADQVRKAFNSPFWPFVLATTSVGQEGLDFHAYCHSVVHWNLPSNPVDLEQREGRVHRYKGHAVRRNVAQIHGWHALEMGERDPWEAMFVQAREEARASGASEIVPFWVYSKGDARIERHIFILPLSREHVQAASLRRSLAIYRMVFGQPRQEDLVKYLLNRVPSDELESMLVEARIELSPAPAGS